MKSHSRFGLVSLAVVLAVACGEAPPPAKTATPPAAAPPAATAPAAASEFGVPECDAYFTKYLACIDSKVPEAARAQVRQSLDATKAAWKQAAQTPQGKDALAMGCKQATETAKTAMTAYGCTF